MINKVLILFLLIVCFIGCDFETNTVNPQMSNSIRESSEHSLLLAEGETKVSQRNRLVKEVWIERSWKNSIKKGKKYRELLGPKNVVVTLNESKIFDKGNYSIDWILTDAKGFKFGSGNNGYDLEVDTLPDSINLILINLKDSAKIDLGFYYFHKDVL